MSQPERLFHREGPEQLSQRLEKTHDYLYEYRGFWSDDARVQVRIFDAPRAYPVVIATEPAENPGTSVTNMIEYLAAEIVQQQFRDPLAHHQLPLFVEHYPTRRQGHRELEETFDLVKFTLAAPIPVCVATRWRLTLGDPTWTRVDRATVEQLIGQPLTDTR